MSFIIDRTRTHQQSLLDLVNFANADTVKTDLSVANTGIEKLESFVPGFYTVRLSNLSANDDYVDVQHTKIQLGDVLTFSPTELAWFNPLSVPSSNGTWDNAGRTMVEAALTQLGFTLGRITNAPNACFVRYSDSDQRWLLTFMCDSFVFAETFVYALPHYWGEDVTQRNLLGFKPIPIGSTDTAPADVYPVDFTLSPLTLLIGQMNFDNHFSYTPAQFALRNLKTVSLSTGAGANTSIELDLLTAPSDVVGDWVTFSYIRMSLANIWTTPPLLTPAQVGLDRNTQTITIPTLIASLASQLYLDETDYTFAFDYRNRRVTITAASTNVAYTGSVTLLVDVPIGLKELVTLRQLNGFEKGKFY